MEPQQLIDLIAEEAGKTHAHFSIVIAVLIRSIAMQPNIDAQKFTTDLMNGLTPSPEQDSWALESLRELIATALT